MTIIIAGSIRVPPENLAAARPVMAALLGAIRAEDGCQHYTLAEDVEEPGLIRIFEAWRDQAAIDAHLQADHIKAWKAAAPGLGVHGRDLRAYQASDPKVI